MRRKITRHLRAKDDIISSAYYIAEDSLDASDRFLDAVEDSIERIAEMPGMGTLRDFDKPFLAGMRMFLVTGFRNYGIYYFHTEESIEILRVLHGAQDIARIFEREGIDDPVEVEE